MRARFIIENFEKPSEWVVLEYRHAARLAGRGNLTITGAGKLAGLPTDGRHAWEIGLADPIILDPAASEVLEPGDFSDPGENFLVLGGICGDFPPKARTGGLLTSRFPDARVRSLGSLQLPTDIALWTAREISRGRRLSGIAFFPQMEFRMGKYESVSINLGYPLVKGKPLVTPGLAALLRKRQEF